MENRDMYDEEIYHFSVYDVTLVAQWIVFWAFFILTINLLIVSTK